MFDARLRVWIDPPLNAVAANLSRTNLSANQLTLIGLVVGLGGAATIAAGAPRVGLLLFLINRLFDGLDGALARRKALTDRGGFLDIVSDFLIYATIPLAFAFSDPVSNALPIAALLASFIASGVTFLAFAAIAAGRGLSTTAQGAKSIYYLAGLAEGFETIVAFVAMCVWPDYVPVIATTFAVVCAVSAVARIFIAMRALV